MRKPTIAALIVGISALAATAASAPAVGYGQITFRNVDPKRLGYVPLQKPIQPPQPYLPPPGLQQEIIRPDPIQFHPLQTDDITFRDLRQNRIEQAPTVQDELVQQPIAPQWEDRDIIGPEKAEPQALQTRKSFRFESPVFLPVTRLQPGMDDSMMRTPSLFDQRPPAGTPRNQPSKVGLPSATGSPASWLRVQPMPASRDGRRLLGW